ncbi:MAG: OmpH family outer membrane protein [Bryobacteraceae bacterium]
MFVSAKGAAARRQTMQNLARSWGDALHTAPTLPEFFVKVRGFALLAVLAAYPICALHAQAQAPLKVAIINAQKAVADTAEIKKAQASLETKYKPRTDTINKLQSDLQNIQQQLRAPNLAPDREAQLNADGTRTQRELQRMNEDLQSDFNNDRSQVLSKTGRQMQEIVRKIAEERGYDVVIDVSNTVYYKPALEITSDATAAYDKAYPVK